MCVRYVLHKGALYDWIERVEKKRGEKTKRSFHRMVEPGESFPGEDGSIIRLRDGVLSLESASWGLQPSWTHDPLFGRKNAYNARAETVFEKPSFRTAARHRRCLLPASGFYERQSGRWLEFRLKGGGAFAAPALYEEPNKSSDEATYTMITTEPNETVAKVHDRMPVILDPDNYDTWLDPATSVEELKSLLVPCPPDWFDIEDAGPIRPAKPKPPSLFD